MAVSRPFLLALVGIVLLAATVFAVQNASQQTGAGAASSPATPAQPAQPAATLSSGDALAAAFSTAPGSARFDLEASLRAEGRTGTLELSGAADDSAKDPRVELDLRVDALGTELQGGFVTTGGEAWFTRGDTGYLVPQEIWDGLRASGTAAPAAAADPAVAPDPAANPLQQLPFDPAKWVKDVKDEGTQAIDGVETRHVSASIDAGAAVRDVLDVVRRQGGAQAASLPPGTAEQVQDSVKRADFDVWVGTEDRVLRRLTADVELAVPGSGPVELALDLELSDVGRPQQIEPPAEVSEQLPGGEFGVFMRTLLEGSSVATGGDPAAVSARLDSGNNPRKLQRALREHRKVVLLFTNSRGLDDRIVERSLDSVREDTRALVLADEVVNVDRYGSLVESLGVSQTPSIVLIDRNGKARLVEGYVDAGSLVQVVTDAR